MRSSSSRPHRSQRRYNLFESLEPRNLMASVPTGVVDTFNRTTISGYALNKDDGHLPVNIEITLNGEKTVIAADDYRENIIKKLGSPYHAFTYEVPTLPAGTSKLLIQAVSPITGARKTLRQGTLTNPVPKGKIETITNNTIAGYAYDTDSSEPIQIRVDVDGVAGEPFFTDVARPELQSKLKTAYNTVGFTVTGEFAGKVVEVFAIDAPTDTATLLYTNNKKPIGKVEVNDGLTLSGWALDSNDLTEAIGINVYIDGELLTGSPFTADVDRQDLVAKYGTSFHGFAIDIPGLTAGTHTISVYAVDGQASSQAPVFLGSAKVTNAAPKGKLDTNGTSSMLTGWALDPNLGSEPSIVNVYIDDQWYDSIYADLPRADYKKYSKTPNHGFAIDVSEFGTTSHSITLTVMDDRESDQNEVVFYDGFLNNTLPVGKFEPIVNGMMTGWAFDADDPDLADPVDVYVNGVYVTTIIANQSRSDVDAMFPTPNHAFSAPLPTLSFGTHKIDLYAAESQGNISVLIGSQIVKNVRPVGALEIANMTTISGYVADADALGTSVQVQIYINGILYEELSTLANGERPDLLTKKPFSANQSYSSYGFTISLPELDVGRNQIDIYAVDLNNGLFSPIGSRAILIAPPSA